MDPVSNLPPVGLPPVGLPPVGLPPSGTTPSPTPTTGLPPVGLPPIGAPVDGGGLPPTPPGTPSGLGVSDFTAMSNYVGSGAAGAVGTVKSIGNINLIANQMRGSEIKNADGTETHIGGGLSAKMKGSGMVAKEIGASAITGAKYGAIIGGGISALTNAYNVLTGKESTAEGVGRLVADTATATVSGAGGAAIGGLTAFGLSSMLNLGGLSLAIPAAGMGLVGAVGITYLAQKTGLYDAMKNSIQKLFGAK